MSEVRPHPLAAVLHAALDDRFPPVDGTVRVVPPLHLGLEAVVSFTGHVLVCTTRSQDDVDATGVDAFGGAEHPDFVRWLAGAGGWINVLDAVMVRRATGRGGGSLERRVDLADHPRARYATSLRHAVQVHADDRGVVTLGRGVCGRWELGFEVADERNRGQGVGRGLLVDALGLLPSGTPVFAQVSSANARSMRVLAGCGFRVIGSEVLVRPERPLPRDRAAPGGGSPRAPLG